MGCSAPPLLLAPATASTTGDRPSLVEDLAKPRWRSGLLTGLLREEQADRLHEGRDVDAMGGCELVPAVTGWCGDVGMKLLAGLRSFFGPHGKPWLAADMACRVVVQAGQLGTRGRGQLR